jgi:hypothetical protein
MNEEKNKKLLEKIVSNQALIESVERASTSPDGFEEYYFTYPNTKYLWSIVSSSSSTNLLYFYPDGNQEGNYMRVELPQGDSAVTEKLRLLFEAVRGKVFGFDKVIDDILS